MLSNNKIRDQVVDIGIQDAVMKITSSRKIYLNENLYYALQCRALRLCLVWYLLSTSFSVRKLEDQILDERCILWYRYETWWSHSLDTSEEF